MSFIEAKIKSLGQIHAMPRKVFWIGMPESIRDKNRMDLLQKDIWVENYPLGKLTELETPSEVILFINLDPILHTARGTTAAPELSTIKNLIKNIQTLKPMHTLVHSTIINPKIQEVFTMASITYMEKNLHDTASATAIVLKLVNHVYETMNRTSRSYLRIEIADTKKIPVKCQLQENKQKHVITGFLADLSLNGMQIKFYDENLDKNIFLKLKIKDFLEISLTLDHFTIKIQKALIVRMDSQNKSISVYFDIHNEKMIKSVFADSLTDSIYQLIKEFQKNRQAEAV